VAEKLAAQYSSMLKLTPAQLVLGDSDDSIKDIISKLDEVAGVEADNNGEGTNANKAEALALKATLYRLIAKELMERKVNAEVQGTQAAEDSNADTTPTTDVVVSEPVIIIDTNSDQLWIVYNNVKTSYYLQQKADDGYIIWRAVSGAANNNVGSINATGFIEIRSSEAEKVFVSGTTLKQLSDYEFVSGSNSFEKRVVVSPSTPIKEEEVKVDAVNNEKISQENVISLEISQKVGDKSYITNNKENTKYYLKTNGAGYEIFRGMPWWKTDYSVGSIRTTGTININSADEENVDFIEGMKLGDLEKYRFLDNKFVE
jgi:hypothetical protein